MLRLPIARVHRVEVAWTLAVRTQAERSGRIVQHHIAGVAGAVADAGVGARAASDAVGVTRLTLVPVVGERRLGTLGHTVRTVLEVAT